jgi:hypothetical protein
MPFNHVIYKPNSVQALRIFEYITITPGLDSYTQVNLVIILRQCLISFFSLILTLNYIFLAGLRKVHLAYRMVNAGWAGVFNRVPTLCNQLLPHLLADILQALHSCYGHIEDVHVTFWKCSDIFRKISMFGHFSKNFHVVELSHFSSMF